jgi:2,3-dimethylmalate lyase
MRTHSETPSAATVHRPGEVTTMNPGSQLREVFSASEMQIIVPIYDGLSVRLAELCGFKACMLGGSTVTNTMLGLPDCGYLTLTEMEWAVSRVTEVSSLPVLVDVDDAYGNAINVVRTVRRIENAGAAGIQLEDQMAPKRSTGMGGKTIISVEEAVGKIKAAVDSRSNSDFVIVGRTYARLVDGIEAAIERANLYAQAGADVVFVYGIVTKDELARMGSEVKANFQLVNVAADTAPSISLAQLRSMGFSAAAIGGYVTRAAANGIFRFLEDVRARGLLDAGASLVGELEGTPLENWDDFTGMGQVRSLEERYLPTKNVSG